MLKKIARIVIMLCLLLGMMTIPVSAMVNVGGNIEIMSTYYRSANAFLNISSGEATAEGNIYGYSGITTKTTVHLYLQRYKDGKWEDVDDWLSTGETVNRSLTKTKQVTKGYKYRAKASCYAYSGTKYEHVTKYSGTVSY